MARISARELAELVPCQLEYVSRLQALRLLEPDGEDGQLPPSSVHLVRLMAAFEAAGIALEGVARGVAGVVQESAQRHGGRPVKWLGDGVMFHFADPARAILGGLELIERPESAISRSSPRRATTSAGPSTSPRGSPTTPGRTRSW